MPGLEIHTLNQVEIEAAVRAGDGAMAGRLALRHAEESPVTTGDFSLPPLDEYLGLQLEDESPGIEPSPGGRAPSPTQDFEQIRLINPSVYSVYGEPLRGPNESYELFDFYLRNQDDPAAIPKRILDRTRISDVTGCWLPDYYRSHSGYVGVTDREIGITPSGSTGLHRAARARYEIAHGEPLLTTEHDVEHACRCTTCFFPGHTWRLSGKENNQRKDQARYIEAAMVSGQTVIKSALGWEEESVSQVESGDAVVVGRFGAFRYERVSEWQLMLVLVRCVARERMRRLGKKPEKRYQKLMVNTGQLALYG